MAQQFLLDTQLKGEMMDIDKAIQDSALYQQVMAQPPEWAHGTIGADGGGEMYGMSPYMTTHYRTSNGSVNVFRVAGTTAGHPACGLTWLEFLQQGGRMAQNLQEQAENPGYYSSTGPKGMHLTSMDGVDWHVEDGLHRIAIAAFMFREGGQHYLHGVGLEQFGYDWQLYTARQQIMEVMEERGIAGKLSISRSTTPSSFEDGPGGWSLQTFEPQLAIEEPCMPRRAFSGDEAFAYLKEITGERKRRWWAAVWAAIP